MSPINITNLLVKIASNNVKNATNRNVTSQNTPLQQNLPQQQSPVVQQNNALTQGLQQQQNILMHQNLLQNPTLAQNIGQQGQSQQIQQQNILQQPQNQQIINQQQAQQNIVQQQNALQQPQNQQVLNQQQVQQQNILQQQNVLTQRNVLQQQNIPQPLNQQVLNQPQVQQNIVQQQYVLQQPEAMKSPQDKLIENLLGKSSNNAVNTASTLKLQTDKSVSARILAMTERNQNINYVKDMMKLPQEMKDVLSLVQQNQTASAKAGDSTNLLLLSNINIKNLTHLIQNGSKEALKLVMETSMAQNLSKAELSQIKEALSYLNASASSQESQTQALKNFMLLYLPWLPLQEGMDFELDFSFTEGSEEDDENILNIVIMTKHFGEIHILIILNAMNSFEIYIQCCKNFPKNKLLKLIGEDERKYTLQTNMVFEESKNVEPKTKPQEAKITLSHVKEISPFLLLIANSLIKYTLLLDAQRD